MPPIEHACRRAPELPQHAQLVVDLGAAGDEHERALDLAQQLSELLELPLQQEPGVGREQLRDAVGRGVRAVRRAESVVDEEVGAVGELAPNSRVVRRLARVEARVLEHADPLVAGAARASRARDRASSRTPGPAPSAGRGASRRHLARRRAPAGSSSVGSDARIRVSSATRAVLERHVQVGAHEHVLAGDVGVANGARPSALDGGRQRRADLETRSTSRHE